MCFILTAVGRPTITERERERKKEMLIDDSFLLRHSSLFFLILKLLLVLCLSSIHMKDESSKR